MGGRIWFYRHGGLHFYSGLREKLLRGHDSLHPAWFWSDGFEHGRKCYGRPGSVWRYNPAAASNLANVFFGLGLFLTPLIVSFLFRKTSYEIAVSVLGIIIAIPIVVALLATGYPSSSAKLDLGAAVKLLGQPAVLVAAFVLFCYIALESSFCNWLPSFGKEVVKKENPAIEAGLADARGQRLLSFFAIAMMAGRLETSLLRPSLTLI
jgi:fucose permease